MHRKNVVRTIAALLIVSICFSALACFASAKPFTDVSATSSSTKDYLDAINWISDNGYMNGTTETTFSPNEYVTRAMFVTVLYRFAGSPTVTNTVPYTDVPSNAYFYNAVRWGHAKGIVTGTSPTTFSPYQTVTREQSFTFLWRFAKFSRGYTPYMLSDSDDLLNISDTASISPYALEPCKWAISNGLLQFGSGSHLVRPANGTYRKELALWLCRFNSNVDGIIFGEDNYGFVNNSTDFVSTDKYLMSTYHKEKLLNSASSGPMRENVAITIGSKPDPETGEYVSKWQGACYGISLSCILDMIGQIDVNGNYTNGCKNLNAIPSLRALNNSKHKNITAFNGTTISSVESVVNYYWATQMYGFNTNPTAYGGLDFDLTEQALFTLTPLIEAKRDGCLMLLNYRKKAEMENPFLYASHTIVIYGPPYRSSGSNDYRYKAYDPNDSTVKEVRVDSRGRWINIDRHGGTITPDRVFVFKNFEAMRPYDIDSSSNSINSAPTVTYANEENDHVKLYVTSSSPFTVTNAEGETLEMLTGSIGGTMEVYRDSFFVMEPTVFCFEVPYSKSFSVSFMVPQQDHGLTVDWDGREFGIVQAENTDVISISRDGVSFSGDDVAYIISRSVGDGTHSLVFSGKNESSFLFEETDGTYAIHSAANTTVSINNIFFTDMENESDRTISVSQLSAGENQFHATENLQLVLMPVTVNEEES